MTSSFSWSKREIKKIYWDFEQNPLSLENTYLIFKDRCIINLLTTGMCVTQ